ncbi:MAG TPA: hypothetical protein VGE35_00690 [Candidatus Paceibacterota bacterium]
MSKKIVVGLVAALFIFGASFGTVRAQEAQSGISFAQLIELLIGSGLIAPERAANARAMISSQPLPVGYVASPAYATTTIGTSTVATSTGPMVDLKVSGLDSVSVNNRTTVRVSWTSTGTRSCNASGSLLSIANGGQWGYNGLLGTSGSELLVAATSGSLPSTVIVGIQCFTNTGSSVSDSVPVTITASGNLTTGTTSVASNPFVVTYPTSANTLYIGPTHTVVFRGGDSDVRSYSVYLVGGALGSTGSRYLGTAYPQTPGGAGTFAIVIPSDIQPGNGYQIQFSGARASGGNSASFGIVRPPQNTIASSTIWDINNRAASGVQIADGTISANIAGASTIQVNAGDSMTTLARINISAAGSDVSIQRIKMNLGSVSPYNKVFKTIYFTDSNGTVLAQADINANTVPLDGGSYTLNLGGFSKNVSRNTTHTFNIKADIYSSIPSANQGYQTISVGASGIRGMDASGIDRYAPASGISQTLNVIGAPISPVSLVNGITYSSVPSSVVAGSTFNVTIANSGTKQWGAWHDIAISANDLSFNTQMVTLSSTPVGSSKTVTFTAPTTPGTYKIRAVEQGVEWFGGTRSFTVTSSNTQTQSRPISGSLSVASTCVVPGASFNVQGSVAGDGVNSVVLEKDSNQDGVFGTAATWGSTGGSFNSNEGGSYSGRLDFRLVVNGTVRDSKSVTVSTACGPQTQQYSQSCAGTQPSGEGVVKGYSSYTSGYGTTNWTFVSANPQACQWSCASGYGVTGNTCQPTTQTSQPAQITYQACSGTEPSGSNVTKGGGMYSTGYGTTNWTYVSSNPQACQFTCSGGATWNGAACVLPTPTVSLTADTSCAVPGSTITVTSYVTGSPITSNYIERDTPAENSQYGDGIFGGKADYGTSGGSHSYSQTTEREGYYDFKAVVNNSITSSVRVYASQSCGQSSAAPAMTNLGSAIVGFDSLVRLLELLK